MTGSISDAVDPRFAELCAQAPGSAAYPPARFRVEWGPIFHRGRLDGSARVLVIGQDPAAHEAITRRVLCGVAGHRVQGFLARLGVDRSYVIINAFLYSLHGTDAPTPTDDQLADRYAWIDAVLATSPIELVVTFGSVADRLWKGYVEQRGPADIPVHAAAVHPTAHLTPAQLTANWNAALAVAHAALAHPDRAVALVPYGAALAAADLVVIPAEDLAPGVPAWMAGAETWAERGDGTEQVPSDSRITVTIPASGRIDR